MSIETVAFDAAEFFTTEAAQNNLINDALESGDARYISKALGVVARARGMGEVAAKAGVTREALYKALSENGDPKLSTLMGVAKALGIKFQIAV